MESSPYRFAFAVLCGVTPAGVAYLLGSGGSRCLSPPVERPRHEDYWALEPDGTRDHVPGISGAALMVVMRV